jgi:hypothetical protein
MIAITPPIISSQEVPTVACNMLPEPVSLPRFTAVRIIIVSTIHERIIELLVQGSHATRDGVDEIILPVRCGRN